METMLKIIKVSKIVLVVFGTFGNDMKMDRLVVLYVSLNQY